MPKERKAAAEVTPLYWDAQARPVPADSPYAKRLADLHAATRTIGDTYAARLAWVVRFVREDPAAHSAVRAADGDCLAALASHGFPESLRGGVKLPQPFAPEDVIELHAEMRTFLRAVVNGKVGEVVVVPTEGLAMGLLRATNVAVKPAVWAESYGSTNVRTAVLQAVKTLILRGGERLVACKGCAGPLVSVRKQEYCSKECAQRIRNDRRADKRPRKTERRKGVRRAR
jgi:hypothetical protein